MYKRQALALSLSACGESAAPPQSAAPLDTSEADFTFADLQACRFVHASGASGWGTVLTLSLIHIFIGVGTAIFLGGPGAVFWCWIAGVFGIATKYAESLIAVKYRRCV